MSGNTSYLLTIDKDLYTKCKIVCLTQGISLRKLILDLLEDYTKNYDIDIVERK